PIDVEPLEVDVLRETPMVFRQPVSNWHECDIAICIAQRDRHAPVGSVSPGTGSLRQVRGPQVPGNSLSQLVASADPYDEAIAICAERAVRSSAIRTERSR